MTALFRAFSSLLRLPPQPEPPQGDEGSAVVFRAAPQYLKYRTTLWALKAPWTILVVGGILAAKVSALMELPEQTTDINHLQQYVPLILIGGGVLILLILSIGLISLRLDYAFRWYILTDRSLRVREGIWHLREITITFANVQNLSIEQGPLQRLFGISDVKVDTAGGGAATSAKHAKAHASRSLHTAWLRGLAHADDVRTLIQNRLRGQRDAGLGDLDDTQATPAAHSPSPEAIWAAAELIAEAKALRTTAEALISHR